MSEERIWCEFPGCCAHAVGAAVDMETHEQMHLCLEHLVDYFDSLLPDSVPPEHAALPLRRERSVGA